MKSKTRQDRRFEAPDSLSERSKAIWRRVCPRRARSPERLIALESALQQLDQANDMRKALGDQFVVKVITTGAQRINPLVAAEAKARTSFHRAWSKLGLDWSQQPDGGINGEDHPDAGRADV